MAVVLSAIYFLR